MITWLKWFVILYSPIAGSIIMEGNQRLKSWIAARRQNRSPEVEWANGGIRRVLSLRDADGRFRLSIATRDECGFGLQWQRLSG
jgi:hypothetical protein